MNQFGGNWTKEKIEIFMDYLPAYLKIMHNQITKKHYAKDWKLLYFDGFAGSGSNLKEGNRYEFLESVAMQVLAKNNPRKFDLYYFVELDEKNAEQLKNKIENEYSDAERKCFIVSDNFNKKAKDLADYLSNNKQFKALAFIDPYGMEVEWEALKSLEGLSIDIWILVPTGMGVNRLLKKDGNISEAWMEKLSVFLGLNQEDIKNHFYKNKTINTLFGEENITRKASNTIELAGQLYQTQLETIFKYVSNPYPMKNSKNTVMYHFLCASNNETAVKIADDIISKMTSRIE